MRYVSERYALRHHIEYCFENRKLRTPLVSTTLVKLFLILQKVVFNYFRAYPIVNEHHTK